MFLYHYSIKEHKELKSLNAQNRKKVDDIFAYENNISFFFDPIPLDLPKILQHKHDFWKSGVKLYEHKIHVRHLPLNIPFIIVETPEKTKAMFEELKWYEEDLDDERNRENYRVLKKIEDKNTGMGRNLLKIMAKPYVGTTEKHYRELPRIDAKNPSFELMTFYAATVPHVMTYPGLTSIKPDSIELIKLK